MTHRRAKGLAWLVTLAIPSVALAQNEPSPVQPPPPVSTGQPPATTSAGQPTASVSTGQTPSTASKVQPPSEISGGQSSLTPGTQDPPDASRGTSAAPAAARQPLTEPPEPDRGPAGEDAERPGVPDRDDGPPTLLSRKAPKVGGYGGISVLGSRAMGRNVVFVGGEAAVLLDHRFSIGVAGYGLATHVAGPDDLWGNPQRLAFGYGGLQLRYSFVGRLPYYFTIGTLAGAGAVAYTPEWDSRWSDDRDVHADPLFVVEPSIGGNVNVTRWMRFGAQVSYRFVTGSYLPRAEPRPRDADLSGLAYGGHLQFGWF